MIGRKRRWLYGGKRDSHLAKLFRARSISALGAGVMRMAVMGVVLAVMVPRMLSGRLRLSRKRCGGRPILRPQGQG